MQKFPVDEFSMIELSENEKDMILIYQAHNQDTTLNQDYSVDKN